VCGFTADGVSINWVQYMNQMLTAIDASGPGPDGIALHINSRGYQYGDIHSTSKVGANGQNLYFSFYVYKDWINFGIPASLYHLPLYATECNGIYYWKGGHPECSSCGNPSCCYQTGWMQEIYAEINRWNTIDAPPAGKPRFHCVNMYRWCAYCDPWNIDGSPVEGQMLTDLDAAVAQRYRWDSVPSPPVAAFVGSPTSGSAPLDVDFTDQSTGQIDTWSWSFGDASGSTQPSPSHTYQNGGTYTVSLTVTGPGGSDAETKVNYITVSEPYYTGDFDGDGDTDQEDFGAFQRCLSGPGTPQNDPSCERARIDGDADVDPNDFSLFQTCFSGANVTPPLSCLN
jgi:hypothetical protein